jgi:hypothetical protein
MEHQVSYLNTEKCLRALACLLPHVFVHVCQGEGGGGGAWRGCARHTQLFSSLPTFSRPRTRRPTAAKKKTIWSGRRQRHTFVTTARLRFSQAPRYPTRGSDQLVSVFQDFDCVRRSMYSCSKFSSYHRRLNSWRCQLSSCPIKTFFSSNFLPAGGQETERATSQLLPTSSVT